jgi:hypothetical protein
VNKFSTYSIEISRLKILSDTNVYTNNFKICSLKFFHKERVIFFILLLFTTWKIDLSMCYWEYRVKVFHNVGYLPAMLSETTQLMSSLHEEKFKIQYYIHLRKPLSFHYANCILINEQRFVLVQLVEMSDSNSNELPFF